MHAPAAKNRTFFKLIAVQSTPYSVTKTPLLVLVKTEEYYNYYNNALYAAEIRINYQVVMPERLRDKTNRQFIGSFQHNATGGEVVLTAPLGGGSAVFLDPAEIRGSRVGTYLMNVIVQWAKQWPDADVSPIHILELQAGNGEIFHTERRNRFYEQFNIEFNYTDPQTKESGISKPMKALSLAQVYSWKENITELEVYDYLVGTLQQADSNTRALEDCTRAKDNWAERYKWAENNPSRWFAHALLNKYAPLLGFVTMLLIASAIGYRAITEMLQWLSL